MAIKTPRKIIIDTDIGADIDDALALLYALHSPELKVVGVTTVFRNAKLRARFAQYLISRLDRTHLPQCYAGCAATISDQTGYAGMVGFDAWVDQERFLDDGHPENYSTLQLPEKHGVDFLIDSILEPDGVKHLVAIGPLTNLAIALIREPRIADELEAITMMGGSLDQDFGEWNILCDIEAARIVFESKIPLNILPFELGKGAMYSEAEVRAYAARKTPHMDILNAALRHWVDWVRTREHDPQPDYNPCPYDPLTVMFLTHPEWFESKRGVMTVSNRLDRWRMHTPFVESQDGHHRLLVGVRDREKAMGLLHRRVMGEGE